MLEEKDIADVFTFVFWGPVKQTSSFCFVCPQPWVRVVKAKPYSQWRSQKGYHVCLSCLPVQVSEETALCLLEQFPPSQVMTSADWWCWAICWHLARTCINWSCLCRCWGQESGAAGCALWAHQRIFISPPRVAIYCQLAKVQFTQLLLQRAKNTRAQKFCWSIKSFRASCKALRICFQGSRVRKQHHFFAFVLATGWPHVLCIAITAIGVRAWLLHYLVFNLHPEVLCFLWEFCAQLSWCLEFRSISFVSQAAWTLHLTAWLGLQGELPSAGKGGAFVLGLWY